MKQLFTQCALAALFTLGLASCKKDEAKNTTPDNPGVPDYRTLIKQQDWKYTAQYSTIPIDLNGDGTSETDIYAIEPACRQDDILTFPNDTINIIQEGALKCNPNGSEIVSSARWSLNYPMLTLDQQEYMIDTLNEHRLVFYIPLDEPQGQNRLIYTYTR